MKAFKRTTCLFLFILLLGQTGCDDGFTDPDDPKFGDENEDAGELNPDVDKDTPSGAKPLIDGNTGNWELVWSDEFSGAILNSEKWVRNVSTKTRNPRPGKGINDWRWQEKHVNLNGTGQLLLSAEKVGENAMECGGIYSYQKYEPQYGYFETRLKVAETAKGNHTAFWMTSQGQGNIDGTGNDGAEVDVFESAWVGDFTKAVVHIDGYGDAHKANTRRFDTPGIHDGFHVYGLHWTEDKLDIYYDGVKKTTYQGIWVPKVPQWLWLSVGASFGDGDFLSQPIGHLSDAEVDYVRVWKSH